MRSDVQRRELHPINNIKCKSMREGGREGGRFVRGCGNWLGGWGGD